MDKRPHVQWQRCVPPFSGRSRGCSCHLHPSQWPVCQIWQSLAREHVSGNLLHMEQTRTSFSSLRLERGNISEEALKSGDPVFRLWCRGCHCTGNLRGPDQYSLTRCGPKEGTNLRFQSWKTLQQSLCLCLGFGPKRHSAQTIEELGRDLYRTACTKRIHVVSTVINHQECEIRTGPLEIITRTVTGRCARFLDSRQ